MGLSSSKTTTTQNTSQNSNQTENATTTPVTPDFLTNAATNYVGRIGSFGDMDPNQFVAPASPLQQQAWQNAGNMGEWRQQTATASQLANAAGQGGPNYAGFQDMRSQLNPQMSGGGSAQIATNALGGDKVAPAGTGGQFVRPQNAFSGASSQQQGPAYTYQAPTVQNPGAPTTYAAQQTSLGAAPQAATFSYEAPTVGSVAGPSTYQAARTTLGAAPQVQAQSYQAPQLGAAPQAQSYSYQAPTLSAPGLVSGQSYSAPQLGAAGSYAAARTGAPIGAETISYNPTSMTQASVAPTQDAFATGANAASGLTNLASYQNPYQQDVVGATLNNYDQQTGRALAANQANAARNGALGGSRYAIEDAQLQSDFGNNRAQLQANLLSQGFNTAAGLSAQDAGLQNQTNLFNAGNQTGVSTANANAANTRAIAQAGFVQGANEANQQAANQASQFGTGAYNASRLQQADATNRADLDYAGRQDSSAQYNLGLQNVRDLASAGYLNDASQFGAASNMQASLANQNAQNSASQFGAALEADAGKFNAGNQQQASIFNTGLTGTRDIAQAGLTADANRYGAESGMQAALANQSTAGNYGLAQFGADTNNAANYAAGLNAAGLASYQGDVGRAQLQAQLGANAGAQNASNAQQASIANAGLAGQYGLSQFGADTQRAQNYAGAQNAAALADYQGGVSAAITNAQLGARQGEYNAGANNNMSQFNAGQADNFANRQLATAGLLGSLANDYGAGTRADIATMGQLGDQQRGIEQAYDMAGPAQLQLMGQLSGMTPYDILVGRNVSGTSNGVVTGTGRTVTTQSPSLFDMMMQGGNAVARAYAGGMGG
jgi:hypothetical protein